MFKPEDRHSLTELLAPPPNYAVTGAVATTYCLDFAALTAACIALAGSEIVDDSRPPTRGEFLRAITRLSRRLLIVTNQGMVDFDADGRRRRLGALLDRCIRAVGTSNAAFHPKLWIVRFDRVSGKPSPLYRLICSSRNLTKNSTWEAMVGSEGRCGRSPSSFSTSVAAFLRRLKEVAGQTPDFMGGFLRDLPKVQFEGVHEDVQFLWQAGGGPPLWGKAPRQTSAAILVAPFVEDTFLDTARTQLVKNRDELTLISRQSTLDCLNEPNRTWCQEHAYVVQNGPADGTSQQLHAKAIFWASGKTGGLLLGSANATRAAWGLSGAANWEAMVRITDPTAYERFRRDFVYSAKSSGTLHPWLSTYQPGPNAGDENNDPSETLERYRRELGGLRLTAKWRPTISKDTGTLTLTARQASQALVRRLAANQRIECRIGYLPLSAAGEPDTLPLDTLLVAGATFNDIPIGELSTLAVIWMRLREPALLGRYVVVLENPAFPRRWRERRDNSVVHQELLGRPLATMMLEMLRRLPSESELDEASPPKPRDKGVGRGWSGASAVTGYLELLLDRCATDSAALDDVLEFLQLYGGSTPERAALTEMLTTIRDQRA